MAGSAPTTTPRVRSRPVVLVVEVAGGCMGPAHTPRPGDHMGVEGARVEVRNLTKRFGGFTPVDDLSFSVEPGQITGFLGPNGAGKTTSLRMLLGLIKQN